MTLVLLIDDDPLFADVVVATLGADDLTVGVLSDGRRAVEIIELKRPALVLLDCAMPLIPGIEVLRRIRCSYCYCDVPVMMLTARASRADQEIAMRSGATSYMTKPFDGDELSVAVHLLINDHRARRPIAGRQRLASSGRQI